MALGSKEYDRRLWRGISLARDGRREEAIEAFRRLAQQEPSRDDAWLWLAGLARNGREARAYLLEAHRSIPGSPRIVEALRRLGHQLPEGLAPARAGVEGAASGGSAPARGLFVALVGLLALSLLAGALLASAAFASYREGSREGGIPVLDAAASWLATPTPSPTPTPTPSPQEQVDAILASLSHGWECGDWPAVIARLQAARGIVPGHPVVEEKLFASYYNQATFLVGSDRVEEAIPYFDAALSIRPGDSQAATSRANAAAYLAGYRAFHAGDWPGAIAALSPLREADPSYKDVATLLAEAHYHRGLAQKEAGSLKEARRSYQAALDAKPDHQASQAKLEEVSALLPPPKRIQVDLSEQHLYAWEDDDLVFSWACSTGEPGRPTLTGQFSVLEKLPMAYASIWDLDMPWWLGIYWAGASQNGIHALPILSSGRRLWEGYLGQRVSYGCVILGTEEAETLYDWAEIGTPVSIVP